MEIQTSNSPRYFVHAVLGELEYRGLRFETKKLEMENYQGVAVMNFTEREVPYTRMIEHKHFAFGKQPVTYVTKEYPSNWQRGQEAYYPVNDTRNQELYARYRERKCIKLPITSAPFFQGVSDTCDAPLL